MAKSARLAALVLPLLLTACASTPPQSTLVAPAQFAHADTTAAPAAPAARWWGVFDDPQLDALVAAALAHNRDLHAALARLERARALGEADAARLLPGGGATASFTRAAVPAIDAPGGTRVIGERVGASAHARWELDLFGRLRASARAGAIETQASAADVAALRSVLLADVAGSYFAWQGLQAQLAALEAIVAAQRQQVALEDTRWRLGASDELALRRARGELHLSEARLAQLRAARAQQESRLALLTGRFPSELALQTQATTDAPSARPVTLPTPQWTLEQRPDVAAPRARLQAAAARADAAWADLLPRLTLGGSLGVLAGRSSDLSGAAARAWSVQPALSVPLLDLLQLAPLRRARDAETRLALADYEHAVLAAIADVEASAAGLAAARDRVERLVARRDDAERSLQIATARFAAGAIGQLELIDAQRVRRAAALELAEAIAAHRIAVVEVYRAIGAPAA